MDLKATVVFEKNWDALLDDKRFIINQGSSRSSKTWSICQMLILYAYSNPEVTISIVRKSFPTLRSTVMRDFFSVLKELNLYNRKDHNKTENIFTFRNGSIIEFFSADDEQKLRGRKRDIAWLNEANELLYDDFFQINLRTNNKIIIDYNPSESDCWIYELDPSQSELIKSTFLDNPFLDSNIIKQIKDLEKTDPELWSVYGLGERTASRRNIYSNWEFGVDKPERIDRFVYAVDFGYNHPLALLKIWYNEDKEIYIEKLIYQSLLTAPELIDIMNELDIDKNVEIICDYARPEIIKEMKNNGYYAVEANKTVLEGIRIVKQFKISCGDDKDILKEFNNYQWKKINDKIIDEPVKAYDDIMDALRYGIMFIKKDIDNSSQPMLFF
jgi:phage terminase large subunit